MPGRKRSTGDAKASKASKRPRVEVHDLHNIRPCFQEALRRSLKDKLLVNKENLAILLALDMSKVASLVRIGELELDMFTAMVCQDLALPTNLTELDLALTAVEEKDPKPGLKATNRGTLSSLAAKAKRGIAMKGVDLASLRLALSKITTLIRRGCDTSLNLPALTGREFLKMSGELAKPLHTIDITKLVDFLVLKRLAWSTKLSGEAAEDVGEVMARMRTMEAFFDSRPCLARFLDPPMLVAQRPGPSPPGLVASIGLVSGLHGIVPMADGHAGAGNWQGIYQGASQEACVAAITGLRMRHPDPNGAGGDGAGCSQLRLMAFTAGAPGIVEL